MSKKYEILMLIRPNATQEEQEEVKLALEKTISEQSGDVFVYDKWGKHLLAYPIQKNTYGIYTLVRFECKESCDVSATLKKIKDLLSIKFNDMIMRFLVVRLPKNASTEYSKPDSLEDAPRRDRGSVSGSSYGSSHKRPYNANNANVDTAKEVKVQVEESASV